MRNIPFDQYQRYKNTELIISNIRKNDERFKILEVGANAHKNLEKFLKNDFVTYLDIELPEELKNDSQYILGDATDMKFSDNEFDVVVALDVYEHIPKDRREQFINEVYRVSKKVAIIAAPFNKPEVVEAEIRANEFYKNMSGKNHIWLIEHIEYGLPSISEFKLFLESNNINYLHFSHGNLDNWERLTNMHLVTVIHNDLIGYKNEIDNYYNKFIFNCDYTKDGYRDFFIFYKTENIDFSIENNKENNDKLCQLEDHFYKLLQMGIIKTEKQNKLMMKDEELIKLYIDYGSGFTEENVISKKFKSNKKQNIIFDVIEDKRIRAIRIDPTEKVGKFKLYNISVKLSDTNQIQDKKFSSNSDLIKNNIYYFGHSDPQFLVSLNNDKINSVEIVLEKIIDYSTEKEFIDELIKNLKEEIIDKDQAIKSLNNTFGKTVISMKNKFLKK